MFAVYRINCLKRDEVRQCSAGYLRYIFYLQEDVRDVRGMYERTGVSGVINRSEERNNQAMHVV